MSTIDKLVLAPVVSSDPDSQISKMARDAKRLQVQSQVDSRYDTNLDRDGKRVPFDKDTLSENFSASMDEYPENTHFMALMAVGLTAALIYGIRRR